MLSCHRARSFKLDEEAPLQWKVCLIFYYIYYDLKIDVKNVYKAALPLTPICIFSLCDQKHSVRGYTHTTDSDLKYG